MSTQHERGIALVLALFLMTALSVLGASLMFLSQTETYASMNYRMMSQSRYAAEAGIQKASHFLLDPTQYQMPIPATDPLFDPAQCNYSVSPVTCGGNPVVLSADPAVTSTYPVASVRTNFLAAATGDLTAANVTLTYKSTATLLAMQQFPSFGGTDVVQTWQISGSGGLKNSTKATVEVIAIVETPKISANAYAAFATGNTCGALTFSGNVTTDSYDSSTMDYADPTPTPDAESGDVGTNGNMAIGGSVAVNGNLYTPREGVGSCTEGNVTALTETGSPSYSSLVKLPKNVVYKVPPRPAPSPLPLAHLTIADSSACTALGLTFGALDANNKPTAPATCGTIGDYLIIDGHGAVLSMPSVELAGQTKITLVAGGPPTPTEYDFNSIDIASLSSIGALATAETQALLVNVVGQTNLGAEIPIPIDMTGGGFSGVNTCDGCATLCPTCSKWDSSMMQFIYAGTGLIKLKGNNAAAASVYAPNAAVDFGGTSDLYGSIIAKTVNESGSGNIHYDRRLAKDFYTAGQPMLGTFTWRRF